MLSPDVAHVARSTVAPPPLSPREFEVLHLLVQGCAVEEIGQRMNLSPKTVANYQTLIRQKLGVSSGIELLRAAQRLELMPP